MGLETVVSQMLMNRQKLNALIQSLTAMKSSQIIAVHYIKEHVHVISNHCSPILLHACVFDKIYYFDLLLTNVHMWMDNTLKWQMLRQA